MLCHSVPRKIRHDRTYNHFRVGTGRSNSQPMVNAPTGYVTNRTTKRGQNALLYTLSEGSY